MSKKEQQIKYLDTVIDHTEKNMEVLDYNLKLRLESGDKCNLTRAEISSIMSDQISEECFLDFMKTARDIINEEDTSETEGRTEKDQ